jgi:sulfide:quinone oxidoreductase
MPAPTRRAALQAALAAAALLPGPANAAAHIVTRAHIVIIGAGAAGLATANRLAQRLQDVRITIIDARRPHFYQPGFTLIAAGLKSPEYVVSQTADYLPRGITWVQEEAAEIDPISKTVTTAANQRIAYDHLVLATGLALDYAAIEGMDPALIGKNGIGSVYAGPNEAQATWRAMSDFADRGGTALFLRPETEMKCAGAPLKYAFLTDDVLRRRGNRDKAKLIYNAHAPALFGVPIVSEKVRMLFADRGIAVNQSHVLTAIDPTRRIATFRTPQGSKELGYDFINVVPPMRAPAVVRNSPIPWQSGPFAADGWAEVDMATLRHKRFPEIFAVGDIAGVPKGKTAASVKWQVPVAVDHLVADLAGTKSTEAYNGYTSCPLITRIGQAMLVEFDYDNNLVPSFPGIIAPLEELWITWIMKEVGLKPTYLAMLRGKA